MPNHLALILFILNFLILDKVPGVEPDGISLTLKEQEASLETALNSEFVKVTLQKSHSMQRTQCFNGTYFKLRRLDCGFFVLLQLEIFKHYTIFLAYAAQLVHALVSLVYSALDLTAGTCHTIEDLCSRPHLQENVHW